MLISSYSTLENSFNGITKSMQSKGNSAAPNTLSLTVAINIVNEISERDKRKCNLIVYNLSEEPLDNQHTDKDIL